MREREEEEEEEEHDDDDDDDDEKQTWRVHNHATQRRFVLRPSEVQKFSTNHFQVKSTNIGTGQNVSTLAAPKIFSVSGRQGGRRQGR